MEKSKAKAVFSYDGEIRLLKFILGMAFIFLLVGVVAPIVTLNKFVLLENTFSVLGGVMELLKEGQYFLFLIIFGFSILLPFLKLAVLHKLLNLGSSHQLDKYLHWMHEYGKWSMLDVFVVAVLVVTVKLGAIASVEMRYGLYFFAAAVLLTMFITARVVKLTNEDQQAKS